MAPPSAQEIDENGSGAPAPVQVETAITSSGTNHHMLYPRGSHLAPHHPHHPHHVQAAAGQFQAKDRKIDYNFFSTNVYVLQPITMPITEVKCYLAVIIQQRLIILIFNNILSTNWY